MPRLSGLLELGCRLLQTSLGHNMTKQELIEAVIKQIQEDIQRGDLTALEELLMFVPNTYLNGYLNKG